MNEFRKIKFLILFSFLAPNLIFSQKLVDVLNETITVNSKTAINGKTRILTSARIPIGAKSYIYRITITKKGGMTTGSTLFTLLTNMKNRKVAYAAALTELAITNNDNNSIDAFIFHSSYDADNFLVEKDKDWDACQALLSVKNSCRLVDNCIGQNIYFGFRNNNFMQGLDINIEIVALIDEKPKKIYKSTFGIINASGYDIVFDLSKDGKNWRTTSPVKTNHRVFYTFDQSCYYMRVVTSQTVMKYMTLYPNERYEIIWDSKNNFFTIQRY